MEGTPCCTTVLDFLSIMGLETGGFVDFQGRVGVAILVAIYRSAEGPLAKQCPGECSEECFWPPGLE